MPQQNTKVNPWLVAVIVSMATFMEVLDTSIANVALKLHRRRAGVSREDESELDADQRTWFPTPIILPISGWLSAPGSAGKIST